MESSKFTISTYDLYFKLDEYIKPYKNKLPYEFLFGVLFSLTISFFTSNIKPILGLSVCFIQAIFTVIYLGIFLFLIVSFRKFKQYPFKSVEKFCKEIENEAINRNIEPTCLFIFYHSFDSDIKFLFFFHKKTQSYYLPYINYQSSKNFKKQFENIIKQITTRLCITELGVKFEYKKELDFEYDKFSAERNSCIHYCNKVVIASYSDLEKENTFIKHNFSEDLVGREYAWKSIKEVKKHSKTVKKNFNIVKHFDKIPDYL